MGRQLSAWLALGTLFLSLAACTSSAPRAASTANKQGSPARHGHAELTTPEDSGWHEVGEADDGDMGHAPASPSEEGSVGAAARGDAERGAYEPVPHHRPRSRPGLGTRWGETRVSRVTTTSFQRATPSSPFATARIYYNDGPGVNAMVRDGRRHDHGDNVYRPARGLTVRILDASRRPLPSTRATGRNYVVGHHGQRYLIQIHNHSGQRVEAVASVDGLDVLDGEPAAYGKRGYIVGPWATVEIDGFRRSLHSVAAFRFGSVADSYASRKGKGRNVGVIGVAFFREAGVPGFWPGSGEVHRRHEAEPFPGRFAHPPG